MMDLHVHTYYSDGTKSPEEVVRMAKENGVSVIAITDHDGTDGIPEAMEAGKKYGVKVIPGIEISVDHRGGEMHILGYNVDLNNEGFIKAVELMRKRRAERNEALFKAFAEIGIVITEEDIREFAFSDYIGKPQFARVLQKRGLVESTVEAFASKDFFKSDVIRRIPREKPKPEEGIRIISEAGGIPVLAHPFTLRQTMEQLDATLNELEGYGLMGMECYYSGHDELQTEGFLELARRHGLMITAGSDYHGEELDADIRIGTGRNRNLSVSEKELPFQVRPQEDE